MLHLNSLPEFILAIDNVVFILLSCFYQALVLLIEVLLIEVAPSVLSRRLKYFTLVFWLKKKKQTNPQTSL